MEKEIRICFKLYLNYIKQYVKHLQEYDVNEMSVSDIDSQLDVIHMQCIIASGYSISKTSPCIIAFNHLKKMIADNNSCYKCQCKDIENKKLKQALDELRTSMTSMLMPSPHIIDNVMSETGISIVQLNGTQTLNEQLHDQTKQQPKGWFF